MVDIVVYFKTIRQNQFSDVLDLLNINKKLVLYLSEKIEKVFVEWNQSLLFIWMWILCKFLIIIHKKEECMYGV